MYVLIWTAWVTGLLVLEFGWPDSHIPWVVALAVFAVLEGVGIARRHVTGDTLSENVWKFYGGMPGRVPLIIGFVMWMGCRLVGLGLETSDALVMTGRVAIINGLVSWLLIHFVGRGKYG